MIYAGLSSFFGLRLEDGHLQNFWTYCMEGCLELRMRDVNATSWRVLGVIKGDIFRTFCNESPGSSDKRREGSEVGDKDSSP